MRENLRLRQGQSFDLGIRPEHILINESQEQAEENQTQLVVEVKVVEPLGRETLIRAALPRSTSCLNIQIGGNVRLRPGDRLSLQLDLNQLFVFDPQTGIKILPHE